MQKLMWAAVVEASKAELCSGVGAVVLVTLDAVTVEVVEVLASAVVDVWLSLCSPQVPQVAQNEYISKKSQSAAC